MLKPSLKPTNFYTKPTLTRESTLRITALYNKLVHFHSPPPSLGPKPTSNPQTWADFSPTRHRVAFTPAGSLLVGRPFLER